MTRCIFVGGYHHFEKTYSSIQVAAVLKKEAVAHTETSAATGESTRCYNYLM